MGRLSTTECTYLPTSAAGAAAWCQCRGADPGRRALKASLHLLLLPCTSLSVYRVSGLCSPFYSAGLANGVEYACTLHFAVMHILNALFILFSGAVPTTSCLCLQCFNFVKGGSQASKASQSPLRGQPRETKHQPQLRSLKLVRSSLDGSDILTSQGLRHCCILA